MKPHYKVYGMNKPNVPMGYAPYWVPLSPANAYYSYEEAVLYADTFKTGYKDLDVAIVKYTPTIVKRFASKVIENQD